MLPKCWPQLMVGILLAAVSACAEQAPTPVPPTSRPPASGGPSPSPTLAGPAEPTPSSSPTATLPVASPRPSVAPSAPPGVAIDWALDDPSSDFTPEDLISDATSVGGTLVAVGAREEETGDSAAAAWSSADGLLWRRTSDIAGSMGAAMEDVTAGPAGLVAVGYAAVGLGIEPRAWLSLDGLSWRAVDDADLGRGQMSAVAANSLGYVALGFDPATGDGLVWTSTDASDWSAAMVVPAFDVQPSVNDVVALGDGFLAYGSTAHNERAALWSSRDGRRWQPVAGFPTSPSSTVNAVVASGARLVAVGASYLERGTLALAWTSTDGLEWQPVIGHADSEPGEMLAAVPVGTGFVAVGSAGGDEREDLRAAVWSSVDGMSWQRQADQSVFELGRMSEVVRAGPGLVALGERADDPAMEVFRPVVWLGIAR